jgi:hypothetical protein
MAAIYRLSAARIYPGVPRFGAAALRRRLARGMAAAR